MMASQLAPAHDASMRAPDFSYLTDVHFGRGAISIVPGIVARHQMVRPLVVTDASLVRLGLVSRLALHEPVVFEGTETNPSQASLGACVELYRDAGCDGIVALGGGASLDLGKLAAMMVGHPEPVDQYAAIHGGAARITASMPPVVAVPTTAGSGSEVGRAALLRLHTGRKLGFLSPHLLPKAAVCDAELTVTLSPALTASTGMDALSHCIEAFCSTRFNPIADAIALDGFARGWRAIRTACAHGADLEAREQMQLCSLMGGLAFQKGLGAVHSLSHPLGALAGLNLHHGTLNALFLAPVLRFNASACPERLERLAAAIGLASGSLLPDAIDALVEQLGLPRRLRDLAVPREATIALASDAAQDHCSATNPRRFDEVAARTLYEQTW